MSAASCFSVVAHRGAHLVLAARGGDARPPGHGPDSGARAHDLPTIRKTKPNQRSALLMPNVFEQVRTVSFEVSADRVHHHEVTERGTHICCWKAHAGEAAAFR